MRQSARQDQLTRSRSGRWLRMRRLPTLLIALLALMFSALPASSQDRPDGMEGAEVEGRSTASRGLTLRYVLTYAEPIGDSPQAQAERGAAAEQRRDDRAAERRADEAAADVGAEASLVGRTQDAAAVIAIDRALEDDERATLEAELAAIPGVALVEEDRLLTAMQSNDPLLPDQWHYNEPTGGIGVEQALATSNGAGATIAVIDTGSTSHPDLDARVIGGYDMISDSFVSRDGGGRDADHSDPGDWNQAGECGPLTPARSSSWHGTHVAGTAAAVRGNAEGGHGVAPQADLVVVRVLGRCGGYTTDIAAGIVWAAGGSVSGVPSNPNPADVINLSLGGSGSCDTTTQSAVDTARSLGATVVAAAGNSSANAGGFSPASCDGVVTVAATQRDGSRASYSNYGSVVDLAAPGGGTGGGVLSTLNSGSTTPQNPTYASYNGTSMASPHVAGVAALLVAADSSLSPSQVASLLTSTARAFPGSCAQCGAGILDAPGALAALAGNPDPDPDPDPEPEPDTYRFSGPLAIPDLGTVQPTIDVDRSGNGPSALQVSVDITHTYRGDLVIDLFAPSGASVRLKQANAGDSGQDVHETWTVNATGVAAGGTWTLRVRDVYSGDVGQVDSWSLTF